jgi:hypothetical protein
LAFIRVQRLSDRFNFIVLRADQGVLIFLCIKNISWDHRVLANKKFQKFFKNIIFYPIP